MTPTVLRRAMLTLALLTPTIAMAQTDTLTPLDLYDTSAEARAAYQRNLDILGVDIRPGETLTGDEEVDVRRIMNDQSNPASKADRIENLYENGNQFQPMGD